MNQKIKAFGPVIIKILAVLTGLCLVVAVTAPVHAQDPSTFYEATVPVTSQSVDERRRAAGEALLQVLTRMSGEKYVGDNIYVAETLPNATRYIEQFQYKQIASESLRAQGYRDLILIKFSPTFVYRIINEAGLPFWSENRPNTIIWLVEDSLENGKTMLNSQSDAAVIGGLESAAFQLGLPVSFPLLDLEDRLNVSPEEIWEIDESAIKEASERYRADVILVGRYSVTSRGELWSIWQFFHAGSSQSYDVRVDTMDQAYADMMGEQVLSPLADFLSDLYAIQPQTEAKGRLVVDLHNIRNFADYRGALDYLRNTAAIKDVQVASVSKDSMRLLLDSQANLDRLLSVFALNGRLHPIETQVAQQDVPIWQQAPKGTLENPLQLEWRSR